MPRGEFTIIIAGLAVTAGVEPKMAPLAATYMLITVISGPVLARITDTSWFKKKVRGKPGDLKRPIHILLSYDEETTCLGVTDTIATVRVSDR